MKSEDKADVLITLIIFGGVMFLIVVAILAAVVTA